MLPHSALCYDPHPLFIIIIFSLHKDTRHTSSINNFMNLIMLITMWACLTSLADTCLHMSQFSTGFLRGFLTLKSYFWIREERTKTEKNKYLA